MKMKSLCIRMIEPNEVMLLTDFLYEAIFQPEGSAALSRMVIQEPMVWAYVKDFGQRTGDVCFVAVIGGFIVVQHGQEWGAPTEKLMKRRRKSLYQFIPNTAVKA